MIRLFFKNIKALMQNVKTLASMKAQIIMSALSLFRVVTCTTYQVECWRNGKLTWHDSFHNLVVNTGLTALITNTFKTIPGSVTWYVGLKGAGTIVAGDTMASHSGWLELTPYSDANRQTFTPGSVSNGSVDNSASKAVFNINNTATVAGAFMADNNTKGGTTGILYGAGDFSGGSRSVQSGDVLNVQVTVSAT